LQAQGGACCANNQREGENKGFTGHPAQPGRVDRRIQRRSFPGRASARGLPREDSHSSRLAGAFESAIRPKSELLGLGDHEFVPWTIGVTG
jgi:hypothetical protein